MGKYFVLPIAMTLKNNKIAEHGDVVDESQLNSSPYELIKGGFIRNLTDEEAKDHGEDFEEAEIVEDEEVSETETDSEEVKSETTVEESKPVSAKDKAKELLSKK